MTIDDREKTSGELVRRLIRTSQTATLATLDQETGGAPYGSLVLTACGLDAAPLVLLSDLARHTKNFKKYDRVSLLFAKPGVEAINMNRATLLGRIKLCEDAHMRDRLLRRHASARNHMSFGDFQLYRLHTDSVHFIGGFARIETLPASEVILASDPIAALSAAEVEIVEHMNTDHREAIHAYAHGLADRPGLDWRMTGLDCEGCDLARNDAEARIWFNNPVYDAESARSELVALAKVARREG